ALKPPSYTLSDSALLIKSGAFSLQLALANIKRITPANVFPSQTALSRKALRIDYLYGESVTISPEQKEAFMTDLATRYKNETAHMLPGVAV
ncbi:MAG: PH domain-containing protein, partial [Pseudomonadales bacterium]|nr:PH domain-containing protein [Pseudomonadales bacterium]